jgi:hypothetical protein
LLARLGVVSVDQACKVLTTLTQKILQLYGWYFMNSLLWNNEVYASVWGAGGVACGVGACGRGCGGDG